MKKYEEVLAFFKQFQESLSLSSKAIVTSEMFTLTKDCLFNFTNLEKLFYYEDKMLVKLLIDSIYKIQLIVQNQKHSKTKMIIQESRNIWTFNMLEQLDSVVEIFKSIDVECEERVIASLFEFLDKFQIKDNIFSPKKIILKDEWLCQIFSCFNIIYPNFLSGEKFIPTNQYDYQKFQMISKLRQNKEPYFNLGVLLMTIEAITLLIISDCDSKIIGQVQEQLAFENFIVQKEQQDREERFEKRNFHLRALVSDELKIKLDSRENKTNYYLEVQTLNSEEVAIYQAFQLNDYLNGYYYTSVPISEPFISEPMTDEQIRFQFEMIFPKLADEEVN